MATGVTYDAVNDVSKIFPSEFRKYIRDENLLCRRYRDGCCSWFFRKGHQPTDVDSTYLDYVNELMTVVESSSFVGLHCLIQFWKAEELTGLDDFGERHYALTTCNQPFLIWKSYPRDPQVSEGICSYRTKMVDIATREGGGEHGVVGRVFRNKRMEYTPCIFYYSCEEYPHRDFALSCCIRFSLAIPVSDSCGRLVGVLELVSQSNMSIYFQKHVISKLQNGSKLGYLDNSKCVCAQSLDDESLKIAASEIKEVMKVIGRSSSVVCAQTWVLCNHCESLYTSRRLSEGLDASYKSCIFREDDLLDAEYVCILKKGEGVVGNAAISSHNLVYCEDVSRFSITEYPLAHVARFYKLTSCFAICLKCDLTGSQIYVLEFFLDRCKTNRRDLKATLLPILEEMKQNFRSFKVASGDKIGDYLSVRVIDAHFPDKIVNLRKRKRDLSLEFSTNNIKACRPYILPHSNGESSIEATEEPTTQTETSFCDTLLEETVAYSAPSVESKFFLTIKVNYGGDLFRFQLSYPSGFLEFSQEVSRRLNLEGGTYIVKYLDDDNDWILIVCEDDMREYILSSISQEKYTLMMTIEPKDPSYSLPRKPSWANFQNPQLSHVIKFFRGFKLWPRKATVL